MQKNRLNYTVSLIVISAILTLLALLLMFGTANADANCKCEIIVGDEPQLINSAVLPAQVVTGTPDVGVIKVTNGGQVLLFVIEDANFDNIATPGVEPDLPGAPVLIGYGPNTTTITSTVVMTSDENAQIELSGHVGFYFVKSLDSDASEWDVIVEGPVSGSVKVLFIPCLLYTSPSPRD
jgi:hypothetical protein